MTTIHHAIKKSAAAKGITLTSDEGTVTAKHDATGITVTLNVDDDSEANERAKDAWVASQDMADFLAANPGTQAAQIDDEFVITLNNVEFAGETWDDAVEAFNEREPEDEEGDEDEAETGGSVVPHHYKEQYKNSGVKDSCGDWLAAHAATLCRIVDGKVERVDCDKVELLVGANGVEYANPGTGNRGWEGRYRMTALNMLRKRIADAGVMVVPGSLVNGETETREVPEEFRTKHRSAKEKKRLAALAADEAKEAAAQ